MCTIQAFNRTNILLTNPKMSIAASIASCASQVFIFSVKTSMLTTINRYYQNCKMKNKMTKWNKNLIVQEETCFKIIGSPIRYMAVGGWISISLCEPEVNYIDLTVGTQNNQDKHLWCNLSSPIMIRNFPTCSIKFMVQTKVLFVLACRLTQCASQNRQGQLVTRL